MKNELITYEDPKSPISEVFRALRTNIQFKNSNKELKTILITSTNQSEGKSIVAANLAITFAQAGKKVLIIDADMRKSRQHILFSIVSKPGLSNYLSGIDHTGKASNTVILKYVKETEIENLDIIPAGTIPPNPSELLALDKMGKMIDKLKKSYDLIIFDGAPSLPVTDSIILSRIVDSTLLVVSYKESKREDLKRVQRDIENVGGKIEGVVLNKIPVSINKYKEKYYYGHKAISAEQTIMPTIVISNTEEPNIKEEDANKEDSTKKSSINTKKNTTTKNSNKTTKKSTGPQALITYEPKSRITILLETLLKQLKVTKND